MHFATFQESVQWVLAHGYPFLFIAMLIEGPAVTAAGAFVTTLGYLNIFWVFVLSILGNLIPDVIYYAIGYWGRYKVVDKYSHYFGLSKERVGHLEKLSHQHAGKALTVIKLVPLLATPGLIIVGATRMPIRKYTYWSIVLTLPSSLFFLIIGYYFGAAYNTIKHYLDLGGYFIILALAVFLAISFAYKKISGRIAEKIDKNNKINF